MKRREHKKLVLSKETLSNLESLDTLRRVEGAYNTNPKSFLCNDKGSFWPECSLAVQCPILV